MNLMKYKKEIAMLLAILILLLFFFTDGFTNCNWNIDINESDGCPGCDGNNINIDIVDSSNDSDIPDSSNDSDIPTDEEGASLLETVNGGGDLEEGESCDEYTVTGTADNPYLEFTYTLSKWYPSVACTCDNCHLTWSIYENGNLIWSDSMSSPTSRTATIYNYNGGNIEVCFSNVCCCKAQVAYSLEIWG